MSPPTQIIDHDNTVPMVSSVANEESLSLDMTLRGSVPVSVTLPVATSDASTSSSTLSIPNTLADITPSSVENTTHETDVVLGQGHREKKKYVLLTPYQTYSASCLSTPLSSSHSS